MNIEMSPGDKLTITLKDTDREFQVHFDTSEHPSSLVLKESAGLEGNIKGEANEIVYQEDFFHTPEDISQGGENPRCLVSYDEEEETPDCFGLILEKKNDVICTTRCSFISSCKEKAGVRRVGVNTDVPRCYGQYDCTCDACLTCDSVEKCGTP